MARILKKVLVLTLLSLCIIAQQSIPAMEHKKVIEANHYYSDTEPSVVYNIANVEKQRSLIFVLRNKSTSEASLPVEQNHINIVLKAGNEKSECLFDSYDDLCVIKEIKDSSNMNL